MKQLEASLAWSRHVSYLYYIMHTTSCTVPGWNARVLWYRVGNNNILYDTLFLIIPFSDDFCSIAFGVFSSPHWWMGWRMERLKPKGGVFFLCGVVLIFFFCAVLTYNHVPYYERH